MKEGIISLYRKGSNNLMKFTLAIELLLVFGLFQVLTNGVFLSSRNFSNLIMQGCVFSIMSVSMLLVMVTCNIDLSAGAAVGFLGMLAATLQVSKGFSTPITIVITLGVGLMIGAWNGFWISYIRLPAFIVTLASQFTFQGLTLLLSNGVSIGPMNESFSFIGSAYLPELFGSDSKFCSMSSVVLVVSIVMFILVSIKSRRQQKKYGLQLSSKWIFYGKLLLIILTIIIIGLKLLDYRGIPYAVLLLFLIAVIINIVSKNTPFGRYVYAIGGNMDAAKLSGIKVEKVLMGVYLLMGGVTAIASIVFLGRVGQATAGGGTGFEFSAITGCIVGGASTMGGQGGVIGAILGAILMAALDNGMQLLNLSNAYQYIIKGIVLLLAVALDILSKRSEKF